MPVIHRSIFHSENYLFSLKQTQEMLLPFTLFSTIRYIFENFLHFTQNWKFSKCNLIQMVLTHLCYDTTLHEWHCRNAVCGCAYVVAMAIHVLFSARIHSKFHSILLNKFGNAKFQWIQQSALVFSSTRRQQQ